MKSTWEKSGSYTGKLKVTVDGEEWKKAQDKALRKIASGVELRGFRKGKAPLAKVRSLVPDQQLWLDAAEALANEKLKAGIDEYKFTLVDRPSFDVENMSAEEITLVYDCTVSPDVKLGEYKGLEYDKAEIKVTADEIKAELEKIQKRFTEQVVKEDQTVAAGDLANIDYKGFKDGEPFEGGEAAGHVLEIGSNSFIPGFEDALIGMKAGEEKDIDLTFPEDYHEKSLAGAPVVFKVKVNEVKEKKVPELNDDLAMDLDEEGVETLKDLEKKIQKDLTDSKTKEAENKARGEIVEKAVEAAEIEIPQIMIDDEKKYMLQSFENRLRQQGISLAQYKEILGLDDEKILEQMGGNPQKQVKTRLVLDEIIRLENLAATDEDVEKEFETMAKDYNMEVAQIKQYIPAEQIKGDLAYKKAEDFLYENAVAKAAKPKRTRKAAAKAEEKTEPAE